MESRFIETTAHTPMNEMLKHDTMVCPFDSRFLGEFCIVLFMNILCENQGKDKIRKVYSTIVIRLTRYVCTWVHMNTTHRQGHVDVYTQVCTYCTYKHAYAHKHVRTYICIEKTRSWKYIGAQSKDKQLQRSTNNCSMQTNACTGKQIQSEESVGVTFIYVFKYIST